MELDPGKPFFDNLKKGVDYIETSVRSLKQASEDGFPTLSEPLNDSEIDRLNQFDDSVKNTFADVSTLFNQLMKHPFSLDDLEKRVDELKSKLVRYEDDSGYKEFGYKSFQYSSPKSLKSPLKAQVNGIRVDTDSSAPNQNETFKPTFANLLKAKEVDRSKILRSTFKVTGRNNVDNKRKCIIEAVKMPTTHMNVALPSKIPSQDGKQSPVMPSSVLNLPTINGDTHSNGLSLKYITGCKTSSAGTGDLTPTHLTDSVTDSTLSKYDASDVLIEFTPGLTTTRPGMRGRSRLHHNNNLRPPLDYKPGKYGSARNSFEDSRNDSTLPNNRTFLKKARTPESPIFPWSAAANKIKNSHDTYRISPEPRGINQRPFERLTLEEPKLPTELHSPKKSPPTLEMPSVNIDSALHSRLLARVKTLQDNVA